MSDEPDPRPAFTVRFTAQAERMLAQVKDRRVQRLLVQRAAQLTDSPEVKGKALTGELSGFRSLRAAGQRFRILYTVEQQTVIVYVVAVGLRKEGDRQDIYTQAARLLGQSLLQTPPEEEVDD